MKEQPESPGSRPEAPLMGRAEPIDSEASPATDHLSRQQLRRVASSVGKALERALALPSWQGSERFVNWELRTENGRPNCKIPIDPKTGANASSTDFSTWGTLEQALARDPYHVGRVIAEPEIAVDIDKVRNPETGVTDEWALDLIEWLNSYTELSPSGRGYHIWLKGRPPQGKDGARTDDLEVYCKKRYFTYTQQHVEGTPTTIRSLTDAEVAELFARVEKRRQSLKKKGKTQRATDGSQVSGKKYQLLREGKIQEAGFEDVSAAVQSFLTYSAYYNNCDTEKIDADFRASELHKDWRPFGKMSDWVEKWTRRASEEMEKACAAAKVWIDRDGDQIDDSDQAFVDGFARAKREELCYLTDDQSWWGFDPVTGLYLERRRGPIFEIGEFIKAQEPPNANKTLHRRLHSEKAVSAVERLSKDRPEFRATANQFDPDPWMLGLPGGRVLDLRTGEERETRPSDRLTRALPVAPSKLPPQESCPRWLQYLEQTHPGDLELHGYLQRFFGYAITASVREECIIFFIGKAGSGKNTCYETIQAVFGSYCHQLPLDLLLEEAKEDRRLNHIADLLGKRLGICNEGARSKKLDRNALKNLSGGGMVKGRRLGHQAFDFPMQAKILIVANDPPVLDLDEAMKQRVHVVPFNVVFRGIPGKDDKGLKDYFKTHELAGIALWIVDGCLEWQRVGLNPPASVVSRTNEYFVSADTIDQFIEECCEFSSEFFGETLRLFQAAKAFCEARGERSTVTHERLFVPELKQRLEQRKIELREARPRGNGHSGKSGFWGIRLKEGCNAPF
jgi:putative DNA primase/helicase